MGIIFETDVENDAINFFKDLNYEYLCGFDIEPEKSLEERRNLRDVVLTDRLKKFLKKQ